MAERLELEQLADRAAMKAVRETFRLFGVDIGDQKEVNNFRADIIHAHRMRKIAEQSGAWALRIMISAAVVGALAWLWDGFVRAVGR